MSEGSLFADRLDSWKEIAGYIGRSVRTVIRWEEERGLPVHRIPGGYRQNVYAYRNEIDAWMRSESAGGAEPVPSQSHAAWPSPAETDEATEQSAHDAGDRSTRAGFVFLSRRLAVWIVTVSVTALLTYGVYLALAYALPKSVYFAAEHQITTDHAPKTGLVTDGKRLYFGEWREGRLMLASVPVEGGPTVEIPTPFVEVEPVSISGDGARILALIGEGQEGERALWIIPLHGGSPRRVGAFACHSAAWSPDGRWIAFAMGNALYLTTDEGRTQHPLHAFAEVPRNLHWSRDSLRLLFGLQDTSNWESTLWEIELDGSDWGAMRALVPLALAPGRYNALSPVLDGSDRFFVGIEEHISRIGLLERSGWTARSGFRLLPVANEPHGASAFTVDTAARRLYFLRGATGENELEWFDRSSRAFRPYLPGISARDVDFTRDGRRIVYVRDTDNTLWIAAADGSSQKHLDTAGLINVEMPRWSPDGKCVAFLGKPDNGPYRIFIEPGEGGVPRQASQGIDNQGAPTWSPDGSHLVYGRVMCQEDRACAILDIDRKTGRETMVPGSEGLSTARWSPDGRYIAALRSDTYQVFLLDRRTGEWRKLADGVNGNDLAWAPDSGSVYASRPCGVRPEVLRISIASGRVEPIVDLTDFSKLPGRIDTWFAITPDNSIVFLHIVSGENIFSVQYLEK